MDGIKTGDEMKMKWLSALALVELLLAGFGAPNATSNPAAVAAKDIPVGVVLPLTGREDKPGQFQKEGIELAIKQINEKGGIFVRELNQKLQLREVFYDDGSDQAKSAGLAERAMSSDDVVAVLGGYSTALGEAESVMPDRYQTPWITTGAAARSIFNRADQWMRDSLGPVDCLGSTTAEFLGSLVNQGKLKKGLKLALVVENTD